MSNHDHYQKQSIAESLETPVRVARELSTKLGLEPFDVNYWIVDYDEMNELIAYGGFQHRYPHWRWGMAYDQQRKQRQFLGGKAFEIVNNDDPAHAFLQASNSLADQKAVIAHVQAHSDFFRNNRWFRLFGQTPNAAAMLERHSDIISEYMNDPDISREDVETWIDHILCLEDNINQHQPFTPVDPLENDDLSTASISDQLADFDISEEVKSQVFDEEWLDAMESDDDGPTTPKEPAKDILAFLISHGKAYDSDRERARSYEEWQREVLEIIRKESYYLAPQKMTKVLNEGWAAYWESTMMGGEAFAESNEFISYADHMSKVLGSPGLNPYKLGKDLWEYIENRYNRREVVEQLLRVKGITWRNFSDVVDDEHILSLLEPDPMIADPASSIDRLDSNDPRIDAKALQSARAGEFDIDAYPWRVLSYDGLAERHYSLVKPQNRRFLNRINTETLEQTSRYLFDTDRFASVAEAIKTVDRSVGWNRMREIRESHNDVTFLDEFLTEEFVEENNYFTYEFMHTTRDFRVTSTDAEDVKKKLMLEFTNFGKPTIVVKDGNYRNRNELLLTHNYNGVILDLEQAKQTLERVFKLWGRPVVLKTILKELDEHDIEIAKRRDREPEPTERGVLIRYDGDATEVLDVSWDEVEDIAATDVDYDTKPDSWL